MPAVIAGLIPRPCPTVIKAIPIVAVAVHDDPHDRLTRDVIMHPIGRKSFGFKSSKP